MNGIGNYIHYHRERYRTFGIGRREEGKINLDAALAINKEKLKSMVNSQNINKSDCKKIADYYTDFYYNNNKLNQKIVIKDNNNSILELSLSELIAEVTKLYTSSNNAKYLDGTLVKTELQKAMSKLASTVRNGSKKGDYITRGTFEKYWYAIDDMVKNADKAFARNQGIGSFQALFKSEEQLKKTVNSLKEEFSQIRSRLPKMKKEDALKSRTQVKLSNSSFNNSLQNLINEYENLIIWYQGTFGGSMAGDTHEIASAMVQVIDTMGANLASLTVDDIYKMLMTNFVSGKTGTNKAAVVNGIDISLLATMEENKIQNGKEIYEIKNINADAGTFSIEYKSISNGLTPFGTIDISLNPFGNAQLAEKLGINKANASLKNYSDISQNYGGHTGVNIVSGVRMDMILNMMNTDFVNHYLNLLGCYPPNFSGADFISANRQFLWAGAIRGLIGDRIDKSNDILLINNKQEKKVYVIPTYFLKEEQDFEKYINVKYNPKIEQYNKWNQWVLAPEGGQSYNEQKAEERIAKFISDIHTYKMIVSLNYSGIQKF